MRLRALARRRAPKRTPHYTYWCERGTLHVKRLLFQHCSSAALSLTSSRQGLLPRKLFSIFRAGLCSMAGHRCLRGALSLRREHGTAQGFGNGGRRAATAFFFSFPKRGKLARNQRNTPPPKGGAGLESMAGQGSLFLWFRANSPLLASGQRPEPLGVQNSNTNRGESYTHTRTHFTPQHWLLCHMGLY